MKRGERKIWLEIEIAAGKIASSSNYAEEYMARAEFLNKLHSLPSEEKQ